MTAHQSRIERRLSASRRAGFLRVVFGIAALAFRDGVFPGIPEAHALFALYLVLGVAFQAMIMRGLAASDSRSFAMGAVDVGFLSYAVYLLGPASSVLPFVYLLIPVVHAASSSSRSRVPSHLAWLSAVVYVALVVVTGCRYLPYAPAAHGQLPPSLSHLLASASLVVFSVLSTTSIVLKQMQALDRINRQLADLSNLDELTNLCNRRQLISELQKQLTRVGRGAHCGVMMIDLDRFKRVNDALGHDAGDLLLVAIARALTAETRAVDVVARYGGDEFVIVLPDLSPDGAAAAAQRIVEAVGRVGRERVPDLPVTASIGLTLARLDDDAGSVLRRADGEAYRAKRAGGDRSSLSIEPSSKTSGIVSTPENGTRRPADHASRHRSKLA